ncbi:MULTISPECIES: DUF3152 domain-containing protein [unclassified Kitasatospora]|uniref:DUF3152 domain-containing protein n=1 Tax=unclassified Kitasatospora TaxID=2633591 RepID=UPI0038185482
MPAARSAARSGSARGRRRRRPPRRLGPGMLAALVTAVAVLGGTAVVLTRSSDAPDGGPTAQARIAPPTDQAPSPAGPTPTPTPTDTPSEPPAPSSTPTPTTPTTPDPGPAKGAGTFSIAAATAQPVGRGTVRRYRVEVEDGIGIDAGGAAAQIHGFLGDRRGWTNDRKNGFQLVAGGGYDFTVKIASPATVDRICGASGLDTHGEVNCNVGNQVLVNSKRWNTGSPQFSGPLDEYRALIINHEVGHRIGHGHETCPGPGKPAPAMMQQIYGLKGCEPNAWPYSENGTYLSGPSVP